MKEKMKELNNNPLGIEFIETTEERKNLTETLISYGISNLDNPFKNITVHEVAKDLHIGRNKAYEIFKRKDFPAITIGRTWQVMYLAYLIWKHDNSRKVQEVIIIARQPRKGNGGVHYNSARRNWTASYNLIDLETGLERRVRKSFHTQELARQHLDEILLQKK